MPEARSVVVRLTAETAQYIASMQAAGTMTEGAMVKAEAATMKQSQALSTLGTNAGKVGAAAALGLGAMAAASVQWESQFRGVQKTVNGTASEMSALEDELRGLARTMPATHKEIAATAEAAGQLGVARKDITEFTKVMIELGSSTNLTADEAATSMAQFMNVMRSAPESVDELANTLVDLGNKGASTESQILDMAQRLAGAGQLVGATEADVLGLASAMANLGIQSELGGGAIQRTFLVIYQAVKKGGEDLQGFADLAGMSAEGFAAAWENDPIRAFDSLVKGMGNVQASGGNLIQALDDLGIKGTQNLQVILRLAGAGDELTNSLDESASGWEKNSALFKEYGQRADTTASKIQVAWNQIKDAAIEAGGATLPVVAKITSVVGDMAYAFEQLPGPAKDTVSAMLAITAVLGGGLWFGTKVVGGIRATQVALASLGLTADATAISMGAVVSAAGALALLAAAGGNVLDLQDTFHRSGEAADAATGSVEDLAAALSNSNVGKHASDLGIDIARLATDLHENGAQGEYVSEVMDKLGESSHGAGALVNGLAERLTLGHAGLLGMTDSAESSSAALEDLNKILENAEPGPLVQALDKLSGGLLSGTAATQELTTAEKHAKAAHQQSAAVLKAEADALKKSRDAAHETAASFFGLGQGLDNAKLSLKGWLRQLENQADALANFRHNAVEAADKGLNHGLIAALEKAGPAGAMRMKQLSNATEQEIARANRAWKRGQDEIRKYTDLVGGVPKRASTKIELTGVPTAMQQLRSVQMALNAIHDKTIHVDIVRGADSGVPYISGGQRKAGADGMTVPKTGKPYADRHLILAADGEEIISNRHGQADRHRPLLKAINAGRYADGGTVTDTQGNTHQTHAASAPASKWWRDNGDKDRLLLTELRAALHEFVVTQKSDTSEVRSELHDFRDAIKEAGGTVTPEFKAMARHMIELSKQIDAQRAELEKSQEALKSMREEATAFGEQVAGNFKADLFGNQAAPPNEITVKTWDPDKQQWVDTTVDVATLPIEQQQQIFADWQQQMASDIGTALDNSTIRSNEFISLLMQLQAKGCVVACSRSSRRRGTSMPRRRCCR